MHSCATRSSPRSPIGSATRTASASVPRRSGPNPAWSQRWTTPSSRSSPSSAPDPMSPRSAGWPSTPPIVGTRPRTRRGAPADPARGRHAVPRGQDALRPRPVPPVRRDAQLLRGDGFRRADGPRHLESGGPGAAVRPFGGASRRGRNPDADGRVAAQRGDATPRRREGGHESWRDAGQSIERLSYAAAPWHFLYFSPLPHGHGALRGVLSLIAWFGFPGCALAPPPPPWPPPSPAAPATTSSRFSFSCWTFGAWGCCSCRTSSTR